MGNGGRGEAGVVGVVRDYESENLEVKRKAVGGGCWLDGGDSGGGDGGGMREGERGG